jgi:uncharacterized protein YdeI (YjbR/CyaY-like superfamily)
VSAAAPGASDFKAELPIIAFSSQGEWEEWLDANGATSNGLWVKIAKKSSGVDTVSYAEAVESAICHGWIDGQAKSFDERFWLQRFTPRSRRSKWSRINRDKASELMEQSRLKPAGVVQVEQARADGRWDAAYEPPSRMTVPADLQRELDRNPSAQAFFTTLDSANRYAILYRIHDAKKSDTRARRIEKYIAMLSAGEKLDP